MKLIPRGDTAVIDAYLAPILRRYVARGRKRARRRSRAVPSCSRPAGLSPPTRSAPKTRSFPVRPAALSAMAATAEGRGFRQDHRLRHGRHIDRCLALCRRVRAHAGDDGRGRAIARADDADQHRRGGRRLDLLFRRHALSRRAGIGRRRAGARLLPPRRAADRHRLQSRSRQDSARTLSHASSARIRRSAARHRCRNSGDATLSAKRNRAHGRPSAGARRSIAEGFIKIAVENMANAIKQISIARGYDVTGYTLQCFGGAGGQHACLVADALGMRRVMIHPLAGVLSAYGMGLADRRG